jgi:hypothetical protein
VAYRLRRARRSPSALSSAPTACPSVRRAGWGRATSTRPCCAKSGWILRKLGEQRERRQHLEAARIDWRDGAECPSWAPAGCGSTRGGRGPSAGRRPRRAALPAGGAGPGRGAEPDPRHRPVLAAAEALRHFEGAAPLRRAAGRARAAPAPERGADPLGQRLGRRLDPPELAADPFQPGGDRLWWPRTGPPARDEPQPGLLGRGALGDARPGCAARRLKSPVLPLFD